MTIKPMKAADLKSLVDWDAAEPFAALGSILTRRYAMEAKLDGCGVYWTLGEHANVLHSATRGIDRTDNFPHFRDATIPALAGTVIAAELVAAGTQPSGLLSTSTGLMVARPALACQRQNENGPARLFAFDMLELGGTAGPVSIRRKSYTERRQLLAIFLKGLRATYPGLPIKIVPAWPSSPEAIRTSLASGYEGVMAKYRDGPYVEGSRNAGWYKLKLNGSADVCVVGWRPGENANAGLVGSFEVGIYLGPAARPGPDIRFLKGGAYQAVGHCGNFTDKFRREVTAADGSLDEGWYEKVIEVSAQGIGPGGHLRHCLLVRVRPDKGPQDCGPDQLAALPAA